MAKKRKKARKKAPRRRRREEAGRERGKKASGQKKPAERTAAQAEAREPAAEAIEGRAAADVETGITEMERDAVGESVPATAPGTFATAEDTRSGRVTLRVFDNEAPVEHEVATRAAPSGQSSGPDRAAPEPLAGGRGTVQDAVQEAEQEAVEEAEAIEIEDDEPRQTTIEELSPQEAVAMLAEISHRLEGSWSAAGTAVRVLRRPRPQGSVIMPSCRVIAFESSGVASEMRVATTTVARLYVTIQQEGLDLQLGRICQTVDETIEAWDETPLGQSVILLVNLMEAGGFVEEITREIPEVGEAYWLVYETLRGGATSATSGFLAEQRARKHAKAIGFGPRNVVAAARTAAEAVRWRVEWGYGARVAKAG